MEFTYTVHIADEQIALTDQIIKQWMANHPCASVDDALDAIFAVGINLIDAATAETATQLIGQP